MSEEYKMHGPVQIDIIVYFTDGEQVAKVTYGYSAGLFVPPETMLKIINVSEKCIKEQMGDDWRLCTRKEFQQNLVGEKTGTTEKFAFPGGDDWDKY